MVRLRLLAEKVCDEWAATKAADKPLPKARALIKRIADHGIQATTFGSLDRYFHECRDEGRFPSPRDIATVLFPHAAKKGVIYSIFGWDSAAPAGTMTTARSA